MLQDGKIVFLLLDKEGDIYPCKFFKLDVGSTVKDNTLCPRLRLFLEYSVGSRAVTLQLFLINKGSQHHKKSFIFAVLYSPIDKR